MIKFGRAETAEDGEHALPEPQRNVNSLMDLMLQASWLARKTEGQGSHSKRIVPCARRSRNSP